MGKPTICIGKKQSFAITAKLISAFVFANFVENSSALVSACCARLSISLDVSMSLKTKAIVKLHVWITEDELFTFVQRLTFNEYGFCNMFA